MVKEGEFGMSKSKKKKATKKKVAKKVTKKAKKKVVKKTSEANGKNAKETKQPRSNRGVTTVV